MATDKALHPEWFKWPHLFPREDRDRMERMTGEHLLDDFAVCCRNIATCVVNVASHHIVGEVRLQNNVLGVHMDLRKKGHQGKRDPVREPPFTCSPGKVVEMQTDRQTDAEGPEGRRWEGQERLLETECYGDRDMLVQRRGEMQREERRDRAWLKKTAPGRSYWKMGGCPRPRA